MVRVLLPCLQHYVNQTPTHKCSYSPKPTITRLTFTILTPNFLNPNPNHSAALKSYGINITTDHDEAAAVVRSQGKWSTNSRRNMFTDTETSRETVKYDCDRSMISLSPRYRRRYLVIANQLYGI